MRLRNTLAMAIAVVVLGAFVYFYEIRGREAREAAEEAASKLLTFAAEDVVRVVLDGTEGSVTLEREDDQWRIVEPVQAATEDTAVDTLVNRLESATHTRNVGEDIEDLVPYGLDEPEVRATLELDDGSTLTLELGKGTPVGFNVYARRAGENTVFITAASLKDSVDKSLFDLRDKRILTADQSAVERLDVTADGQQISVRRQADAWRLTAPVDARADANIIDEALRRLGTNRASAFVSEAPTPEEVTDYGLVEPRATVTAWTGEDNSQVLEFGVESEDPAGYYARRRGSEAVFVVPANTVDDLPTQVDDVRNRAVVYDVAREEISAIDVRYVDQSLRVERPDNEWVITRPLEIDADASTMSRLVSDLLGLRARGFAPEEVSAADYGLDQPELVVSLELDPDRGQPATNLEEAEEAEDAEAAAPQAAPEPRTWTLRAGGLTQVDAEPEDEATTAETEEGDEQEPEPIDARYVQVEGDSTVYLVTEEDLDSLRPELFDLRSKTLVSFTQSDLTRIEVTTASGGEFAVEKSGDDWSQAVPRSAVIEGSEVTDLLWDFNYLRMTGVVSEWDAPTQPPDLEPYGLQPPEYRIVAYVGEDVVADLAVGSVVPDEELADPDAGPAGQVYARVADQTAVFRIEGRLRDSLEELVAALQ